MVRERKPKPRIRVLRQLARSGGTLISKCIAVMDGVALLSEVHPQGMKLTKPLLQAQEWYGLITPADLKGWRLRGEPSFAQVMTLIEQRAADRGLTLVLRDWSHLDYIGLPMCEPAGGCATAEALADRYEIVTTYTTRHPLDQFVSLMSLPIMQGAVTLEGYAAGCVGFARACTQSGFVRYEDFTADPDACLRVLCERLGIEFDAGYSARWQSYTNISGEVQGGRAGRSEIKPAQRREVDEALHAKLLGLEDYRESCELLGYEA